MVKVIAGLAGVLVLVCIFSIMILKMLISTRKENRKLQEEIDKQNVNISRLIQHAEELSNIQKDEKKTSEEIKNAKTDKELSDIMASIIVANNNRVSNSSEK